jgi:hypothetical protein
LTVDERGDERAAGALKEIAFPMPRHGAITDVCGSLANRHCVENLPLSRALLSAGPRVSKVMLAAQVCEPTPSQDAATLHEKASVDRLR